MPSINKVSTRVLFIIELLSILKLILHRICLSYVNKFILINFFSLLSILKTIKIRDKGRNIYIRYILNKSWYPNDLVVVWDAIGMRYLPYKIS